MNGSKVLFADLFCGAGGSSSGARKAIADINGEMELVAVNHWPIAIETHQLNHPEARHYITDLEHADPEALVPEGRLDILMASPECTYHSRARGGKPIHDQGRMNPWAVMNWLTKLDVKNVLVENVPEFVHWGRLNAKGRRDKKYRGEHFQAWFLTFQALGYRAEWRMLNAADYGDATSRTRFFLIARKDDLPIRWPEPTHAKTDSTMFPGLHPWRTAREIIDWSIPGRSLLDHPKYKKKQLSVKTRLRISRGLERFGGPLAPLYIALLDLPQDPVDSSKQSPEPFIINRHGENGSPRVHSIDEPFPTITCRGAGYLVETTGQPFIGANRNENVPKGMDDPVPCIATANGGGNYVVEPDIKPYIIPNFGERDNQEPRNHDIDDPVPAITNPGAGSLVIPSLVEPGLEPFILGQQSCSTARDTKQPIPTISTAGTISLVRPAIIQYYGQSNAQNTQNPLSAITRCNKHALVQHILEPYLPDDDLTHQVAGASIIELAHGNGYQGEKGNDRRVHSTDEPLGAITTNPGLGLVTPMLIQTSQTGGNGIYARPVDRPMPTITTQNDINVVSLCAKPYHVDNDQEITPIEDVMVSEETALLVRKQAIEAGIDPRRLLFVNGEPFLLDIRFRMLMNTELAKATGFDDEESAYTFIGNKTQVTKQIGNAVPVNMAAALVSAILSTAQP